MSKRDYIAIAAAFAELTEDMSHSSQDAMFLAGKAQGIDLAAESMANVLAAGNPRFNRETFLDACYGK